MSKPTPIENIYKTEKSCTRGVVIDTEDPQSLGRIRVYIPTIHADNEQLADWSVCGLYDMPEVGDIVIVTFDNDDTRVPMVLANVTKAMQGGVAEATGINLSTAATNSDLIALISRVININECGKEYPGDDEYATVLRNDNGGVSVGLIGWHEDNAREIFKTIKSTDPSSWNTMGGDSLRSLSQSWSGYIPTTDKATIMKNLLKTDAGKKAQDAERCNYISSYIKAAIELGVTDVRCIIYYCDFANQACNAAKNVVKKLQSATYNSLDKFHNAIYNLNTWPAENSANKNRRERTYKKIIELEQNGELKKLLIVQTSSGKLLWPAPGYPVVAYGFGNKNLSTYGRWHPGIDINSTGRTASVEINGQPVVACCTGTVTTGTESAAGNFIRIQKDGEDLYCFYFHLSGFVSGLKTGDKVIVGQAIGYVGSTGNSTGPHLHFEVRDGGTASGSRTESNHGYLVDPELYLLPDGETGTVTTSGDSKKVTKSAKLYKAQLEDRLYGENETGAGVTMLNYVSKHTGIGEDYDPGSLTAATQKHFERMKEAAKGKSWYDDKYFEIITGYRNYKKQQILYRTNELKKDEGEYRDTVSAPGHSEHQLGEAVDIYSLNIDDWETTEASQFIQWLKDNACDYGFIIRYPNPEEVLGCEYAYKPWHLRYVGEYIASVVNNGLLENVLVSASS